MIAVQLQGFALNSDRVKVCASVSFRQFMGSSPCFIGGGRYRTDSAHNYYIKRGVCYLMADHLIEKNQAK